MGRILNIVILFVFVLIMIFPFIALKDIEVNNATYMHNTTYISYVEITGEFEAADNVPVTLSYPVYIKNCHVNDNNYVNKGQLLFTLDMEKIENAVKSNDFTKVAYTGAAINRADFLNISEHIYASEAGYVKDIAAKDGKLILPDEELCVIETSDDILLKITLNQDDYAKISVGDKVEFIPAIASNKKYEATICNKTAKIIKEATLTGSKTVVEVYAQPETINQFMIHGVQFSGKIITEAEKAISALPYEYVNQDEKGEYVTVYNNGNTDKIYIETGIETDKMVEIVTTFAPDTVFVSNSYAAGKLILKNDE